MASSHTGDNEGQMFSSSSPTSRNGNVKGAGELPGLEVSGQALPPYRQERPLGGTGIRVRLEAVHPHNLFAPLTNVEEG